MRITRNVSEGRISALGRPLVLAAMFAMGAGPVIAAAQAAAAPASAAASAPATANGVGSAFELTFWQSLTGSDDAAAYEAYLAKYPDGTFSGLARAKIAAMQRALTVQPAAAPFAPSTAVAAPVPATIPAVAPAVSAAPALAVTPAVVTAATPSVAPGQIAAAAPQMAEMIPASATVAAAEQSSPLTRLLAQLRGNSDASAVSAGPMVTAAPPVQPAPAAAAAPAMAIAAAAPAVPVLAPVLAPALAPAPALAAANYGSARPVMLPVPDVAMPAYFCSGDSRNAFHNAWYRPAVEAATRNNEAAVTYLRQLQQTYDRGQLGRDTAVLNAIAAEARAYQGEAARAYTAQAGLVRQFDVLMAVPLRTCAAGTQ